MDKSDLVRRCQEFADQHSWTLGQELGAGVQGIVFSVKSQAEQGRLAIKAHNQEGVTDCPLGCHREKCLPGDEFAVGV
jgi:hypothetical protein